MYENFLTQIDDFYGKECRTDFYSRFEQAGFSKFIALPLLMKPRTWDFLDTSLGDVHWPRVRALKVRNISPESARVTLAASFTFPATIDRLFDEFIQVAHHYTRLHHFREFPEYFAAVLAGQRYFVFHGDGFCCQLAVLFQGLCQALLKERIKAMYCRNEDFSFSHGYCLRGDYYLDPDLKARFAYREFANFKPATWFVNLIENICIRNFQKVPQDLRNRIFLAETRDYYQWLLDSCSRELSQPGSRWEITNSLLHEVLPKNSEEYDVRLDDYPWKKTYRALAKSVCDKPDHYFMQEVEKPVIMDLPPGGNLELNTPCGEMDQVLNYLREIFFGRSFMRVSIPLAANTPEPFHFAELPWLIQADAPGKLTFRGGGSEFTLAARGGNAWWGMGDCNELLREWIRAPQLTVESDRKVEFSVYYPVNASLFNSKLISVQSGSSSLEVKAAYD